MGKNKDLQKMLTEFEKEFGHIKEWQLDLENRARAQASDAGKLGGAALHSKYSKEQIKEWAKMGGTYGKIQGKKNVESGHWAKCMRLAREACYVAILQCDKKTGEVIKEWKSAVHANKETGISKTAINNNLKGLSKSSGGFVWKYKDE